MSVHLRLAGTPTEIDEGGILNINGKLYKMIAGTNEEIGREDDSYYESQMSIDDVVEKIKKMMAKHGTDTDPTFATPGQTITVPDSAKVIRTVTDRYGSVSEYFDTVLFVLDKGTNELTSYHYNNTKDIHSGDISRRYIMEHSISNLSSVLTKDTVAFLCIIGYKKSMIKNYRNQHPAVIIKSGVNYMVIPSPTCQSVVGDATGMVLGVITKNNDLLDIYVPAIPETMYDVDTRDKTSYIAEILKLAYSKIGMSLPRETGLNTTHISGTISISDTLCLVQRGIEIDGDIYFDDKYSYENGESSKYRIPPFIELRGPVFLQIFKDSPEDVYGKLVGAKKLIIHVSTEGYCDELRNVICDYKANSLFIVHLPEFFGRSVEDVMSSMNTNSFVFSGPESIILGYKDGEYYFYRGPVKKIPKFGEKVTERFEEFISYISGFSNKIYNPLEMFTEYISEIDDTKKIEEITEDIDYNMNRISCVCASMLPQEVEEIRKEMTEILRKMVITMKDEIIDIGFIPRLRIKKKIHTILSGWVFELNSTRKKSVRVESFASAFRKTQVRDLVNKATKMTDQEICAYIESIPEDIISLYVEIKNSDGKITYRCTDPRMMNIDQPTSEALISLQTITNPQPSPLQVPNRRTGQNNMYVIPLFKINNISEYVIGDNFKGKTIRDFGYESIGVMRVWLRQITASYMRRRPDASDSIVGVELVNTIFEYLEYITNNLTSELSVDDTNTQIIQGLMTLLVTIFESGSVSPMSCVCKLMYKGCVEVPTGDDIVWMKKFIKNYKYTFWSTELHYEELIHKIIKSHLKTLIKSKPRIKIDDVEIFEKINKEMGWIKEFIDSIDELCNSETMQTTAFSLLANNPYKNSTIYSNDRRKVGALGNILKKIVNGSIKDMDINKIMPTMHKLLDRYRALYISETNRNKKKRVNNPEELDRMRDQIEEITESLRVDRQTVKKRVRDETEEFTQYTSLQERVVKIGGSVEMQMIAKGIEDGTYNLNKLQENIRSLFMIACKEMDKDPNNYFRELVVKAILN